MKSLFFSFFVISMVSLFGYAPNPYDAKYDWMDKLVERNFLPFESKGINRKSIENTVKSHPSIVRIKVKKNKVSQPKGDKGAAFAMLEYLAATYGLPDLDILYFQQDGISDPIAGEAPIFCSSKKKNVVQGIYFCDWFSFMPHPEWDNIVNRINQTLENIHWDNKIDQLIWRGSTTDGYYSADNWMNMRRGRLCQLSLLFPDLIDARFVKGVYSSSSSSSAPFCEDVPQGNFMTIEEQLMYKCQIILDGTFTTYPGDRWRLLSNSVVFMHESEYGHWFYDALIPWVHYVPVRSDLSDLVDKIILVKMQPILARQMATNARDFAQKNLMSEDIAVYCYKALIKYASLQTFNP